MQFKDAFLIGELDQIPRFLYLASLEFEKHSNKCGIDPMITRIYGRIPGDSGVHEQWRAIDFRDEFNGIFTYKAAHREYLLRVINRLFPRSDGLSTLIWHAFGEMPHHFHLQISASPDIYSEMFKAQPLSISITP